VRDSESASRTLGLNIVQVKVIVGALGAFVAAVGGGFIALDAGVAQPQTYETFAGLVWLAVVVTLGIRSITAAALGGLAFALLPGVFQSYLPAQWGEVPALLFGLGAIMVARNPDGVVSLFANQLRWLSSHVLARTGGRLRGKPAVGGEHRFVPAVPAVPAATAASSGVGEQVEAGS
jgi:branched-chain amino acid transport system permease protein